MLERVSSSFFKKLSVPYGILALSSSVSYGLLALSSSVLFTFRIHAYRRRGIMTTARFPALLSLIVFVTISYRIVSYRIISYHLHLI